MEVGNACRSRRNPTVYIWMLYMSIYGVECVELFFFLFLTGFVPIAIGAKMRGLLVLASALSSAAAFSTSGPAR